ncbi:regulator of microtubule dynamics protein 2-like isoform X1 [Centruroides sculpturatus]|uniref:regulator of microtubule dynamics protein 2-like isoform X1 n=1 Tax=Centruroides sculpturatus TaxID=218467 RepID=UPI000C6EC6FA|nr:regulator of microtubule dynamics protein 2-like isoform X1 [Centruroides sculpturatus]
MDSVLRDKLSMIAALGAGVVVGLSGIYLYYKTNRAVTRELSHLSGTIECLRKEIEDLKKFRVNAAEPKSAPSHSQHLSAIAPTSTGEEAEEEYFDFTDTEEVSGSWATINGPESIGISDLSGEQLWLNEVDQKLDGTSDQKEEIYMTLLEKIEENSENDEYLWRLAKATHLQGIMAQKQDDFEKKKELAFEAFKYAEKALKQNSINPEVHKWYAITIGSLAEYVGVQEKIQNGYTFKKHVDEALRLKPLDPTLHHMLGRWCYEVAMLTWIERKIASTLFSTPPEATLSEARQHLINADNIKSDWKENILFIAKCYIGEGDYASALDWIERAMKLPCLSEDDEIAQTELETLWNTYQSYRQ